jgi:hypothetical protein
VISFEDRDRRVKSDSVPRGDVRRCHLGSALGRSTCELRGPRRSSLDREELVNGNMTFSAMEIKKSEIETVLLFCNQFKHESVCRFNYWLQILRTLGKLSPDTSDESMICVIGQDY